MSEDEDFYTRDRPDNPDLAEDRPRGGGPEEPGSRGNWPVWLVVLLILALFVIFTVTFG
ncbi:hypothetical protein [Streptomyces triticisoli]|jgi:hypothetical protein|uniref:hypothetical protein n=1 Tax=Streptomyces triticisoli TaxID=2182797 RepID=UPI0018E4FB57|nr:hypothetical protein [Streptomyces triticisoli]